MKKKNSKYIEVADGYRSIWRDVLQHRNPKETESAIVATIRVARKYLTFSGIEVMIKQFVKINPTDCHQIISLGCGTAEDLAAMNSIFPSSVSFGVDTSREALIIAKKNLANANANLISASMCHLPFKKGLKFDMLIAGQSLDLDFEEESMLKMLKESTNYSSPASRFYLTFYGTSNSQIELYKCTPIGNALDSLGWTTCFGISYNLKNKGSFARGVFWVEERTKKSTSQRNL
ncbi:MAG: class I SAM-dependent methyltransferase [Candidatus Bathyarchaeia archaeon]|jgi:hypothetical protein